MVQLGEMKRRVVMVLIACALSVGLSGESDAQDQDQDALLSEAQRLNLQVQQLAEMGRYTEALFAAQRVLEIDAEVLGPEHPYVGTDLISIANLVFIYEGDYAKAEGLLQSAKKLLEEALPPGSPHHVQVAPALAGLGGLYMEAGDYDLSRSFLESALKIYETAPQPDEEEAEIIKAANTAGVLNSLGSLSSRQGDRARAELFYERSLAMLERTFGSEHPSLAMLIHNLAGIYQGKGDYAKAEAGFHRALNIVKKQLGEEHIDMVPALNSLAAFYKTRGEYARAEELYQSSLKVLEKNFGPDHRDVATTLNNFAELHYIRGDYGRALSALRRAAEVREKQVGNILNIGSQKQKQLYLNTLSRQTAVAVSLHVREAPQNQDAARFALTTILRRKGRALDVFARQIEALRNRAAPEDRELLNELSAVQAQLARLQLGGSTLAPDTRRDEVARLAAEQERLEDAISQHSAEFLDITRPVMLESVQAALPADTALVELFVYEPYDAKAEVKEKRFGLARYVAYVLHPENEAPQFVDLGEVAKIDAEVERLRAALKDPQGADFQTPARKLDASVMSPIRRLLGPTRRVFLSPDGALNLIPFAALVDENHKYLVESYSLSYLTSGRDLLRLLKPGESRHVPTVLADPLYDLGGVKGPRQHDTRSYENRRSQEFSRQYYPPLLGTAEEAKALGKLWPDAQMLTQDKATERAVKRVSSPHFLHIATHGFFLPDKPQESPASNPTGRETIEATALSNPSPVPGQWNDPLLHSGLVLAGVKQQLSGEGEDGVLTALETAGLDLWGTQLVVLSACESGQGYVRYGAGVYGLRRALVVAGSRTQVMSLWKVSDAGTRDLMVAYYTRLQAGEGRTEALRQVQLAMLRGELQSTQEAANYTHPYYWAAFIASGDWRSLDSKEGSHPETRGSFRVIAVVSSAVIGLILLSLLLLWRGKSRGANLR